MSALGALRTYLDRPGSIAPAHGLTVRVDSIRQAVNDVGRPELVIRYSVPGVPAGTAHISPDEPPYVAEELHAWATVHVHRFRPPEVPTDAALSVELPGRDELWELLATTLDARPHPDGLVRGPGATLVVLTERGFQAVPANAQDRFSPG